MQLISSPTSPFARVVRAVIIEKGLQSDVEIINKSPLEPNAQATVRNPVGKIPCLILPDGELFFDSRMICAYLDERFPTPRLTPQEADAKWLDMRAQALSNGLMDAAFNAVMERKRPDADQSAMWLERWDAAIQRSLAYMAQNLVDAAEPLTLGSMTQMCALGYLDLRFGQLDWRGQFPVLAEFDARLAERDCFAQTRPPAS